LGQYLVNHFQELERLKRAWLFFFFKEEIAAFFFLQSECSKTFVDCLKQFSYEVTDSSLF